jgi:hypothetical protein
MTQEHPITPPPELIRKWNLDELHIEDAATAPLADQRYIATQAARWGADQELQACIDWLINNQNPRWAAALQEGRRPKPPSLKELAQRVLAENGITLDGRMELDPDDIATIRRALGALDD